MCGVWEEHGEGGRVLLGKWCGVESYDVGGVCTVMGRDGGRGEGGVGGGVERGKEDTTGCIRSKLKMKSELRSCGPEGCVYPVMSSLAAASFLRSSTGGGLHNRCTGGNTADPG